MKSGVGFNCTCDAGYRLADDEKSCEKSKSKTAKYVLIYLCTILSKNGRVTGALL